MLNNKPVICLTSDTNLFTKPQGPREIATPKAYSQGIARSGGVPIIAPELCPEELSELADALLLTGGCDIEPELYGESKLNDTVLVDPIRTEFEFALAKAFLAKRKPIMGICRGIQVINVVLGGTLYQDLPEQCGYIHTSKTLRHYIYAEENTVLCSLFGEKFKVNSSHHQAVKHPAPGLRIAARSIEGIIEAVQHESLPVIATQFHPELLCGEYHDGTTQDFSPLFRHFVDMARAYAESRE